MAKNWEDLEKQLKLLTELKCRIAFDFLVDMTDRELESVPSFVVTKEEIDFCNSNGIVIDVRENFRVYEYGKSFARLTEKENKA